MTSDIQAVCERLEAACKTIERGNPMTAVDSIRGVIRWMSDMDAVTWIPVDYEADGEAIKEDNRPEEGELVIVTLKTESGRRYPDIDKCVGGKWNWYNGSAVSKVIAWASVTPYQE